MTVSGLALTRFWCFFRQVPTLRTAGHFVRVYGVVMNLIVERLVMGFTGFHNGL